MLLRRAALGARGSYAVSGVGHVSYFDSKTAQEKPLVPPVRQGYNHANTSNSIIRELKHARF